MPKRRKEKNHRTRDGNGLCRRFCRDCRADSLCVLPALLAGPRAQGRTRTLAPLTRTQIQTRALVHPARSLTRHQVPTLNPLVHANVTVEDVSQDGEVLAGGATVGGGAATLQTTVVAEAVIELVCHSVHTGCINRFVADKPGNRLLSNVIFIVRLYACEV